MSVLSGEVIRVDLIAEFDGAEDVINVFQLAESGVDFTDNADVLDDIILWATALVTVLKSIITTFQFFQRIRVQNISTGEVIGERNFATPIQGTGAANVIPSQCAVVTVLKTGIPHVNLRKFWGVTSTAAMNSNGDITAPTLAVEASAAAFLMTPFVATMATWVYGYLSPKTASYVIPNSVVISNKFATQRRRREGVGS